MLYITLNGGYRATDLSPPPHTLSLSVCVWQREFSFTHTKLVNSSGFMAKACALARISTLSKQTNNNKPTNDNETFNTKHRQVGVSAAVVSAPLHPASCFGMSNEPSRALKIKIRAKACDSARATDRQGKGKDRWTDRQTDCGFNIAKYKLGI